MPKRKSRTADTFESFAVKLLMCSPGLLGRAWTDSKKGELEEKVQAALDALPLTSGANKAGFELLTGNLVDQREFFRAIADSLKESAYGGTEPHPDNKTAGAIITALQQLDQLQGMLKKGKRQGAGRRAKARRK